ncbi:DctP family TRAP transporter solute-binding subunit [Rummeliibacillus sp. POC4]|uniref:DctP family TRAP transporter solute-binding subunit n=1 Tax=Rummeliibacillus sp. POC4 TaxID=2305899 RepID=UPI000E669A25|nr:DctP family TRAP transporter solute-binding subunit [Rummeliibacillus sp. POC4]RIJ64533.1 DctP family TRAP transporter solute-binding subunit [Rummeliibacillus sp. POC4]
MKIYITTAILTIVLLLSYIGYSQQFWQNSTLPVDEEQQGLNKQIVINFSHVVAEDTPKGQAAIKFAELLEQKSNGRIHVVIYPNGMLYNDNNELKALQNNDVQMIAPTFSKMTKTIPSWEVLDLPYLFHTDEEVENVLNGRIGEQLLNQLNHVNIKGLAFWNNGFKQMISEEKPLVRLEDFKNIKVRAMPSKVLQTQFELLGAKSVNTSFDELYTEIENHEIDAQENTLSNIYSKGFYKVQNNITLTNHGLLGYSVLMNEDFWNSLPQKLQEDVLSAMKEATEWNFQMAKEMNSNDLEKLKKQDHIKINTLSVAEQNKWKLKFKPLYSLYKNHVGATFLKEIQTELNH